MPSTSSIYSVSPRKRRSRGAALTHQRGPRHLPLAMPSTHLNQPHSDVLAYWSTLKNTGIEGPKLKSEDLVFIGVRDTETPEDAIIKRYGITNHTVETVRELGTAEIIKKYTQSVYPMGYYLKF